MRRLPEHRRAVGLADLHRDLPERRRQARSRRALRRDRRDPGVGHVAETGFKRTRATAYDILRATEVHRYKVVMYENVPEFATDWELYAWWVQGFKVLGYRHVSVSVNATHIGGEGNDPAAQWRDRYFGMFVPRGMPLPDLSPRPLAWCPECRQDVAASSPGGTRR